MVQVNGNSGLNALNGTGSEPQAPQAQKPKISNNSVFVQEDRGSFVSMNGDGLVVERYYTNEDGTVDMHVLYEYDEFGREVKASYDKKADGNLDCIVTTEYDENNNNPVKYSHDENADGNVDLIKTLEYDEFGREVKASYDENADGKDDTIYHHIYDTNGKNTYTGYDNNGDGTIDEFQDAGPHAI